MYIVEDDSESGNRLIYDLLHIAEDTLKHADSRLYDLYYVTKILVKLAFKVRSLHYIFEMTVVHCACYIYEIRMLDLKSAR